jgi:hypothetical protein
MGSAAKSYMRKGFLIFEKMRKYYGPKLYQLLTSNLTVVRDVATTVVVARNSEEE